MIPVYYTLYLPIVIYLLDYRKYIVCVVNITLVVGLVQFQIKHFSNLNYCFSKNTTYIVFKSVKIMHMFFSSSFNENMLTS